MSASPIVTPTTYQKIATALLQTDPIQKMSPDEAADFVTQKSANEIEEIIQVRPLIGAAVDSIIDGVITHCIEPATCQKIYSQKEYLVYLLMNRIYMGVSDEFVIGLKRIIPEQSESIYQTASCAGAARNELCICGAIGAHQRWASCHVDDFLDPCYRDHYRHLPFWFIGAEAAEWFWTISNHILHDIGCPCDPIDTQTAYENYATHRALKHIENIDNYKALLPDQILLELVCDNATRVSSASPRGYNTKVYEQMQSREFIYDVIFPQLEKYGLGLTVLGKLLADLC